MSNDKLVGSEFSSTLAVFTNTLSLPTRVDQRR